MNRTLAIILFVVAVGVAFYAGRHTGGGGAPAAAVHAEDDHEGGGELSFSPELEARLGLRTAAAEVRALEQAYQATGVVGPDETRLAHMRALASGRIEDVYVRLGDRVRKGQRLLTYDNIELGDAIGAYLEAMAALDKAESEAEVAKQSLRRAGELVELGAVARAEFQRREAEHKNALATIESAKATAASSEEKLHRFGMSDPEIAKLPRRGADYHRQASHSALIAPFSGVVTEFDAAEGETVGREDALITVADLSTVWVLADVYEKDIRLVREGQSADVLVDAYPGRAFPGRVTHVGDVLDPNTRAAKVRVEAANPDGALKLQMFAKVRIAAGGERRAVAVPAGAVQKIDGQDAVFVKAGDRYERRGVTLGERGRDWVEIVAGLSGGEAVVTEGAFVLKSQVQRAELGHEH